MKEQKNTYANISEFSQKLLAGDEGFNVDFKRSAKGLTAEDLVAFANSEQGGTLLLGVDEVKDEKGRQRGKVVGCEVSDGMKLLIMNRAISCVPALQVHVIVENNDDVPFYRVEIPSGKNKPYCTSGGTYKIRENGRNKVLAPDELLSMFIKSESSQFSQRFKKATLDIMGNDLGILKKDMTLLHQKINVLMRKLGVDEIE